MADQEGLNEWLLSRKVAALHRTQGESVTEPRHIVLQGKKLYSPDGQILSGTIVAQKTPLGTCDQHEDCPGPVVEFHWADGRKRRECLYALIKGKGYQLRDA